MSDDMNPNNEETGMKDSNQQQETSNEVQYSFWAEQMNSSQQSENLEHLQYKDSNPFEGPTYNEESYGQDGINQEIPQPEVRRSTRRGGKVVKFLATSVAAGAIAGGCFVGVIAGYNYLNGDSNGTISIGSSTTANIASTTVLEDAVVPDTDVTQVYKNTLPSIVAIDSTISQSVNWFGQTYEQDATGSGSGIIVGETDTELLIATNNHVVDGATKIMVTFKDGTSAEGITKGTDASADLAVVSIDISSLDKETLKQIKVAAMGNSDDVLAGEMAIAIGNALGYGQSITVGYISAINRIIDSGSNSMKLLQTDAAINPGNSGGALLNNKGEVIGINSSKLAADSIEGMGYAIPISYAYPILEELMSREIIKEEDQGYLGVYIKDITQEISEVYSMPMGVYVRGFSDGSAAQEAGILERDIITGIDGVEVTTSTALKEKVISYRYGTKVTLTIQRSIDGTYVEKKIDVTLGKNPEYEKGNKDNSEKNQKNSDESSNSESNGSKNQ